VFQIFNSLIGKSAIRHKTQPFVVTARLALFTLNTYQLFHSGRTQGWSLGSSAVHWGFIV